MDHKPHTLDETARTGLSFIEERSGGLICRCMQRRGGTPPGSCIDDIRQGMHLGLCEKLGPDYLEVIGRLLLATDGGPPPKETTDDLITAMSWAIDRQYWRDSKRTQRGLPSVGYGYPPGGGIPAPEETAIIDLALDIDSILSSLSPSHRAVWQLKRTGLSNREVGAGIGLSHQQVGHILDEVIDLLAQRLVDD